MNISDFGYPRWPQGPCPCPEMQQWLSEWALPGPLGSGSFPPLSFSVPLSSRSIASISIKFPFSVEPISFVSVTVSLCHGRARLDTFCGVLLNYSLSFQTATYHFCIINRICNISVRPRRAGGLWEGVSRHVDAAPFICIGSSSAADMLLRSPSQQNLLLPAPAAGRLRASTSVWGGNVSERLFRTNIMRWSYNHVVTVVGH